MVQFIWHATVPPSPAPPSVVPELLELLELVDDGRQPDVDVLLLELVEPLELLELPLVDELLLELVVDPPVPEELLLEQARRSAGAATKVTSLVRVRRVTSTVESFR